jgi:transposase-like protein
MESGLITPTALIGTGATKGVTSIIRKLRTADQLLNQGQSVADVCRALEVSAATYHRWQQLYGGMKATEAKRLKELEQENSRLKRLLADAELDKAMLKELAEGNF